MKNDIPEIKDLLNGIQGQEIGKPSKSDSGSVLKLESEDS